jgi:hypothetical protein
MIFEPLWKIYLKRAAVILAVAGAYLWVSVDEREFEQEQATVQAQLPSMPEPDTEPDVGVLAEPLQHNGWTVPPEPIRKSVARVKRKIKKSVEKQ